MAKKEQIKVMLDKAAALIKGVFIKSALVVRRFAAGHKQLLF